MDGETYRVYHLCQRGRCRWGCVQLCPLMVSRSSWGMTSLVAQSGLMSPLLLEWLVLPCLVVDLEPVSAWVWRRSQEPKWKSFRAWFVLLLGFVIWCSQFPPAQCRSLCGLPVLFPSLVWWGSWMRGSYQVLPAVPCSSQVVWFFFLFGASSF
ncbi:hypothetical protein OJAV_G00085910 [Oryzias javanicus]|uniref:Uncharacterized protein n=1 Tax=Oryzias javanicus TaxID=123683 RepID=A0A437CZ46_ORYJA|nr:hypothetical protein OJAV_G00085910 [Oryzias javanicus]